MKNAFLLVSCILLLLAGCKKKEDPKPKNTITATVSGVDEDLSVNASAFVSKTNSLNHLLIEGANDKGKQLSIDLQVQDREIAKGVYTFHTIDNTGSILIPASFKGWMTMRYIVGPLSPTTMNNLYGSITNGTPSSIVVTCITDNNIKGTFYSELRNMDNVIIAVYNGNFDLELR
ncbi:MAG: hypothetical protein V4619_15170 [Bacteroidota bacterium]